VELRATTRGESLGVASRAFRGGASREQLHGRHTGIAWLHDADATLWVQVRKGGGACHDRRARSSFPLEVASGTMPA
jgi:hypothetical protein